MSNKNQSRYAKNLIAKGSAKDLKKLLRDETFQNSLSQGDLGDWEDFVCFIVNLKDFDKVKVLCETGLFQIHLTSDRVLKLLLNNNMLDVLKYIIDRYSGNLLYGEHLYRILNLSKQPVNNWNVFVIFLLKNSYLRPYLQENVDQCTNFLKDLFERKISSKTFSSDKLSSFHNILKEFISLLVEKNDKSEILNLTEALSNDILRYMWRESSEMLMLRYKEGADITETLSILLGFKYESKTLLNLSDIVYILTDENGAKPKYDAFINKFFEVYEILAKDGGDSDEAGAFRDLMEF